MSNVIKIETVELAFSTEEKELFEKLAKEAGMSIDSYLRRCIKDAIRERKGKAVI